ncbi:MAG: linear amide C-N hydrolase [Erysipelotrichaceae bacterium]|nr:linear amide C-N hydrolase [Erysipelotrichaceae bacterium]
MNPHAYITDKKQIEALESIKRVDDKGYLYHMVCNYDYYSLPEIFTVMLSAGCSTFVVKNQEGEVLFCRNYDYSHFQFNDRSNPRTGLNMVIEGNNPKAKYRSIGAADTYWVDFKNGSAVNGMLDDGKTDLSPFIISPYLCMDGMNEKGLAISILALSVKCDYEEISFDEYEKILDPNKINMFLESPGELPNPYWIYGSVGAVVVNKADRKAWKVSQPLVETTDPDKKTYLHTVLMRLVLDNCANVDEALMLFGSSNVKGAMPGADYHIMVADSTGKSRLIEWIDNRMVVTDINHATNHYVGKEDPFYPEACGRDECLKAGVYRGRQGMRQDYAERLLSLVVQDPDNGMDRGKTQYSCVYNLNKKTLKIFSFGDMSKSWEYELK